MSSIIGVTSSEHKRTSMILLSHPTGNQNSRQAALALGEAGVLERFVTAAHFGSDDPLVRLVPSALRRELLRRDFSDVVEPARIAQVARVRELTRLAAPRLGLSRLTARETGWACVDRVYHAVDRAVARRIRRGAAVQAVYAYEDGALAGFQVAHERGIARVYELPIGYWRTHRRLCKEEAALQPEWAHTWQASLDSEAKLARKDSELALASQVIVPSRFVAESLSEYPGQLPPVAVVPYGCPRPIAPEDRRWYAGGVLRVLYVGGLSQRKGFSYLLDALRPLGDAVSLTVIGTGEASAMIDARHRQLGSVAHARVLEEMRQHDLFVFPTLFEGYSLAIAEALSQGLPVVTTANSGAADIIQHGVQGLIVPIRDSGSITAELEELMRAPEQLRAMGRAALALAASWTWSDYRRRLREVVLDGVQRA